LVASGATRIRSGMIVYQALRTMRQRLADPAASALFQQHVSDLGYALLLKRYTANVVDATPAQITAAANNLIPQRAGAVLVVPRDGGHRLLPDRLVTRPAFPAYTSP
jgi:hypothetical protein